MNSASVLMQRLVFVAQLASSAVLYVLLALSVISIGVIIERWWYFRRRRDDIDALSDGLRRVLGKGELDNARKLLAASPSVEAQIITEALDWWAEGYDSVEQILVKAVRARRKKFEAGLLFLGTLGNNAPFIGLFGTVLGIVTAFRELGTAQMGAMGNVMGGIAEALISTAVGILVALPAVVFYNVFQKKGADVEEQAGALGNVVLASMKSTQGGSNGTRHGKTRDGESAGKAAGERAETARRPGAEA
ncbi:MAG: MotA/TolQ/ExbB proton channel family protein [Myxococcales bacterium]|nr:MotA/TolQ/ExbB proton channel family protein [Myxococcales bacterium]